MRRQLRNLLLPNLMSSPPGGGSAPQGHLRQRAEHVWERADNSGWREWLAIGSESRNERRRRGSSRSPSPASAARSPSATGADAHVPIQASLEERYTTLLQHRPRQYKSSTPSRSGMTTPHAEDIRERTATAIMSSLSPTPAPYATPQSRPASPPAADTVSTEET
jgi:hypothetical protein